MWATPIAPDSRRSSTGFRQTVGMLGGNAIYAWQSQRSTAQHPGLKPASKKGQKLPNTPKFQGSLWATYTWPVEFISGSEMFLRGQYSYTGKTHTRLVPAGPDTPQPSFTNDSYSLLDFRLGLIAPDGRWQIDLFVNNVTDERAQISQGSTHAWQWGRTGEYEHAHTKCTRSGRGNTAFVSSTRPAP